MAVLRGHPGSRKLSGTGLSSLQMILYIDFFQQGSVSRPAWMALRNSLKASSDTSTNLSGTWGGDRLLLSLLGGRVTPVCIRTCGETLGHREQGTDLATS